MDYKVDRFILMFALRYVLGRKTTASQIVVDNIKANIDKIPSDEIQAYIKEIEECKNYGMEMDRRVWMDFKTYLQDELNKRKQ